MGGFCVKVIRFIVGVATFTAAVCSIITFCEDTDVQSLIESLIENIIGDNSSDGCCTTYDTELNQPEESITTSTISYVAGQEIDLYGTPLYAVADDSQQPVNHLKGKFYLYDGKIIRGFMRICPTVEYVCKEPIQTHVTGWIKIKDLN